MEIWTIEEEAERLKARFDGVNRAKFARDNNMPGGQAMIYQHIRAVRPISLDAARIYAKGFGISIDEISPRLAAEIADAAAYAGAQKTHTVEESRTAYPVTQKNQELPRYVKDVVEMMLSADDEGQLRAKIAASDALEAYRQAKERAERGRVLDNLPATMLDKITQISNPAFASSLDALIESFLLQEKQRKQM